MPFFSCSQSVYAYILIKGVSHPMDISSSASDRNQIAATKGKEDSALLAPVILSERSITGFALIRIFVGYLWFQQLFWKMPPDFAGLYKYIVLESRHAII